MTKETHFTKKGNVSNPERRDIWAEIALIKPVKLKVAKLRKRNYQERSLRPKTLKSNKIMAKELVNLVCKMEQGEKDKVIQEVFMKEDFGRALTWWPGEEPFICSNVTLCILLDIEVWKSLFHFKLHTQGLLYYNSILLPPVLYNTDLALQYRSPCMIHISEPHIWLLVVLGEFRSLST